MSGTPAGWYPTAQGLRYWDGVRWTDHFAPVRPEPESTRARPRAAARRGGAASWMGWGGLALTGALGAASSGLSGLMVLSALYVLVVAAVALARGRVGWAHLRGRAPAGAAVAGALLLAGIGGATADPAPSTAPPTVAAPPPTASSTPDPTPTPSTSPTPSAVPTTPPPTPSATPTPTPTPPRTAAARGTALAALAALPVKGRAPKTGYDRDRFGQAWADTDRNGCDTRNDILRRDLTKYALKAGTNGCLVLTGTLAEPYTGRKIAFVRGQGTSSTVQIDHVVALSDAWQKGAQQLDESARTAFANDPLNLLAVHGPTNQSKGDGDAATWLPPRKGYRCAYVARQVAVKAKYHLWVTAAERDAIDRVLSTCPTQKLPTARAVALGGGRVVTPATPKPTPRKTTPTPSSGTDPRFGTCKAAIAAGYGPYRSGTDPEYDWYRDNDHDGVVCE